MEDRLKVLCALRNRLGHLLVDEPNASSSVNDSNNESPAISSGLLESAKPKSNSTTRTRGPFEKGLENLRARNSKTKKGHHSYQPPWRGSGASQTSDKQKEQGSRDMTHQKLVTDYRQLHTPSGNDIQEDLKDIGLAYNIIPKTKMPLNGDDSRGGGDMEDVAVKRILAPSNKQASKDPNAGRSADSSKESIEFLMKEMAENKKVLARMVMMLEKNQRNEMNLGSSTENDGASTSSNTVGSSNSIVGNSKNRPGVTQKALSGKSGQTRNANNLPPGLLLAHEFYEDERDGTIIEVRHHSPGKSLKEAREKVISPILEKTYGAQPILQGQPTVNGQSVISPLNAANVLGTPLQMPNLFGSMNRPLNTGACALSPVQPVQPVSVAARPPTYGIGNPVTHLSVPGALEQISTPINLNNRSAFLQKAQESLEEYDAYEAKIAQQQEIIRRQEELLKKQAGGGGGNVSDTAGQQTHPRMEESGGGADYRAFNVLGRSDTADRFTQISRGSVRKPNPRTTYANSLAQYIIPEEKRKRRGTENFMTEEGEIDFLALNKEAIRIAGGSTTHLRHDDHEHTDYMSGKKRDDVIVSLPLQYKIRQWEKDLRKEVGGDKYQAKHKKVARTMVKRQVMAAVKHIERRRSPKKYKNQKINLINRPDGMHRTALTVQEKQKHELKLRQSEWSAEKLLKKAVKPRLLDHDPQPWSIFAQESDMRFQSRSQSRSRSRSHSPGLRIADDKNGGMHVTYNGNMPCGPRKSYFDYSNRNQSTRFAQNSVHIDDRLSSSTSGPRASHGVGGVAGGARASAALGEAPTTIISSRLTDDRAFNLEAGHAGFNRIEASDKREKFDREQAAQKSTRNTSTLGVFDNTSQHLHAPDVTASSGARVLSQADKSPPLPLATHINQGFLNSTPAQILGNSTLGNSPGHKRAPPAFPDMGPNLFFSEKEMKRKISDDFEALCDTIPLNQYADRQTNEADSGQALAKGSGKSSPPLFHAEPRQKVVFASRDKGFRVEDLKTEGPQKKSILKPKEKSKETDAKNGATAKSGCEERFDNRFQDSTGIMITADTIAKCYQMQREAQLHQNQEIESFLQKNTVDTVDVARPPPQEHGHPGYDDNRKSGNLILKNLNVSNSSSQPSSKTGSKISSNSTSDEVSQRIEDNESPVQAEINVFLQKKSSKSSSVEAHYGSVAHDGIFVLRDHHSSSSETQEYLDTLPKQTDTIVMDQQSKERNESCGRQSDHRRKSDPPRNEGSSQCDRNKRNEYSMQNETVLTELPDGATPGSLLNSSNLNGPEIQNQLASLRSCKRSKADMSGKSTPEPPTYEGATSSSSATCDATPTLIKHVKRVEIRDSTSTGDRSQLLKRMGEMYAFNNGSPDNRLVFDNPRGFESANSTAKFVNAITHGMGVAQIAAGYVNVASQQQKSQINIHPPARKFRPPPSAKSAFSASDDTTFQGGLHSNLTRSNSGLLKNSDGGMSTPPLTNSSRERVTSTDRKSLLKYPPPGLVKNTTRFPTAVTVPSQAVVQAKFNNALKSVARPPVQLGVGNSNISGDQHKTILQKSSSEQVLMRNVLSKDSTASQGSHKSQSSHPSQQAQRAKGSGQLLQDSYVPPGGPQMWPQASYVPLHLQGPQMAPQGSGLSKNSQQHSVHSLSKDSSVSQLSIGNPLAANKCVGDQPDPQCVMHQLQRQQSQQLQLQSQLHQQPYQAHQQMQMDQFGISPASVQPPYALANNQQVPLMSPATAFGLPRDDPWTVETRIETDH